MTTLTEHYCAPRRGLTHGSPEDLPSEAFPSLGDKILQFCLDLDDRSPDAICPGCGAAMQEWGPLRSSATHRRAGSALTCGWTGRMLGARALRRSRIRAAGLRPDDGQLRVLYGSLEGMGLSVMFREGPRDAMIGIVSQFHVEQPVATYRGGTLADALGLAASDALAGEP